MVVHRPEALHRRHRIDLAQVGLVLCGGGVAAGPVQPERPGGLQRHPRGLLLVEVVQSPGGHVAGGEGHLAGLLSQHPAQWAGGGGAGEGARGTGRSSSSLVAIVGPSVGPTEGDRCGHDQAEVLLPPSAGSNSAT